MRIEDFHDLNEKRMREAREIAEKIDDPAVRKMTMEFIADFYEVMRKHFDRMEKPKEKKRIKKQPQEV